MIVLILKGYLKHIYRFYEKDQLLGGSIMSKLIDSRLVGQTIKQLRLSRNWTQDHLADIVGYSVRNLRRIENDGTTSIDVVNTFANIFEVSAIDILDGCLFVLKKIKKGIGSLHHTLLTLICYSRTFTLG